MYLIISWMNSNSQNKLQNCKHIVLRQFFVCHLLIKPKKKLLFKRNWSLNSTFQSNTKRYFIATEKYMLWWGKCNFFFLFLSYYWLYLASWYRFLKFLNEKWQWRFERLNNNVSRRTFSWDIWSLKTI